ncbi:MAG: hypothetical protein H6Q91_2466 [Deltaproteobacteria bacterium]|nr:hypothetical protein [Deltaproteobacteria bacterium]
MQVGLVSLGDCHDDPVAGTKTSPAQRHRAIVEEAVLAESLGFDAVWLGEHHSCDSVLAAPPVVLAAIAARTARIRLGANVTRLANLDPVRVAEDYATVDAISNGRVELSVGRGILVDTDEGFGQKSHESRERFRENLELLRRLWSETGVSWSGRFRAPLDRVTVEPRPVQAPHPPIWVGGESSPASVDLAVELGLPLMLPSVLAPPADFLPLVQRYRERWAAAGRDPAGARVACCNHVHVAANSRQARLAPQDREGRALRAVRDSERLLAGIVCGSPGEVVDRIAATRETLGLDLHLSIFDGCGLPPAQVASTVELFATQVLPHVR